MATKPHHDAEQKARIETKVKSVSEGEGELFEYEFGPRGFNIVWGNDRRYWRLPPSRLPVSQSNSNNNNEFAELVQVSWLEVTGSAQLKESNSSTSYKISFLLSFTGDATGWSNCPVFLMAKVGKKGKYKWKKLQGLETLPKDPTEFPSSGEPFQVEVIKDQMDTRLYFGLYEVWSGKWKKGLRVHKALVKVIQQTKK